MFKLNYTPEKYSARAAEILATKCVYLSFPRVNEDYSPTGERERVVHLMLPDKVCALEEEQVMVSTLCFKAGYCHSWSGARALPAEGDRARLVALVREHHPEYDGVDDEHLLFAPGIYVSPSVHKCFRITDKRDDFDRLVLPHIGTLIEPSDEELAQFVAKAKELRATIRAYFAGREILGGEEYDIWAERKPELLKQWADYFLSEDAPPKGYEQIFDEENGCVRLVQPHEYINDWPTSHSATRYAERALAGQTENVLFKISRRARVDQHFLNHEYLPKWRAD